MALEYLNALYPAEEPDKHDELRSSTGARVVPGRLPELLRRNWGLNSILHNNFSIESTDDSQNFTQIVHAAWSKNARKAKNCSDHRHHAHLMPRWLASCHAHFCKEYQALPPQWKIAISKIWSNMLYRTIPPGRHFGLIFRRRSMLCCQPKGRPWHGLPGRLCDRQRANRRSVAQ